MDLVLVDKHMEFRNEMQTQREIFHGLKKEFFNFLTKYM